MSNVKDPLATGAQMCQFCGVRPRYYDKGIGKLHPFCGKTCASKSAQVPKAVCEYCQERQTSGPHLFCGKTCAAVSKQQSLKTCSLTGCTQKATMYSIGTYWNYCSAAHEELALRGCIYCRTVPYIGDYFPLCIPCDSHLAGRGPFILPVPQDHTTYWAVHDQFTASWAHPIKKERLEVRMVYRIISAQSVWDNYWAYRDVLEARGKFSAQGKYPGNEHLLWHGTVRACRLGEPGQNVFCTNPGCFLCSIAQGSFNLAFARTAAWQRFGLGIYTSSQSSKSDSYVKNKVASSWKAMLLNNVLAGSKYTTMYDRPTLKGPPPGHDSVYGKPGKDLNYDELVVYTEHAIRPAYLVMYELVPN